MLSLVATMLATCNPPTLANSYPATSERPVYQISDLPDVRAREAVFERAGILSDLQDRDELERDILYFHASRESVERLVARYDWLDKRMAEALKREVSVEQGRSSEAGAAGKRSTAQGDGCDTAATARVFDPDALLVTSAEALTAPQGIVSSPDKKRTTIKICVGDRLTGRVAHAVAEREASGVLRTLDGDARVISLDRSVEAADRDWYKARDPIIWKGKTYHAGTEWQESAINRYLRHQGSYRGVPLLSIWPAGDVTLAVLVNQESCTFRSYVPADD